jgi:hypothetical protein
LICNNYKNNGGFACYDVKNTKFEFLHGSPSLTAIVQKRTSFVAANNIASTKLGNHTLSVGKKDTTYVLTLTFTTDDVYN